MPIGLQTPAEVAHYRRSLGSVRLTAKAPGTIDLYPAAPRSARQVTPSR
jgi:hypothetical protein